MIELICIVAALIGLGCVLAGLCDGDEAGVMKL